MMVKTLMNILSCKNDAYISKKLSLTQLQASDYHKKDVILSKICLRYITDITMQENLSSLRYFLIKSRKH